VAALGFQQARDVVIERVMRERRRPAVERVRLDEALGRVLAEDVVADRDYPPFDRSVRDGFAVRAEDLPGPLKVVGEVRAGCVFEGTVGRGEAVEIMTGAGVPDRADCVVMIEHTRREGGSVVVERAYSSGEHISQRGIESKAGERVLAAGTRVGSAAVGLMASVGMGSVGVFRKPRVAVLATGDEIVGEGVTPLAHQIRNSNSYSLAAQVRLAGGEAVILPVAPDLLDETVALIERGLECDMLLLSGGVSAGKYDVVEQALERLGAEFYFDRVLIQPGQPLVYGRARGKFFFGLPGNPASAMVCFEVFARAALDLLSGMEETRLPVTTARLTRAFKHRPGLTRFLPAKLEEGARLTPIGWAGSGDVGAMARADCWLVADPQRSEYGEGDEIGVLLRG
jgi:molybdopterin molybdotransferase